MPAPASATSEVSSSAANDAVASPATPLPAPPTPVAVSPPQEAVSAPQPVITAAAPLTVATSTENMGGTPKAATPKASLGLQQDASAASGSHAKSPRQPSSANRFARASDPAKWNDRFDRKSSDKHGQDSSDKSDVAEKFEHAVDVCVDSLKHSFGHLKQKMAASMAAAKLSSHASVTNTGRPRSFQKGQAGVVPRSLTPESPIKSAPANVLLYHTNTAPAAASMEKSVTSGSNSQSGGFAGMHMQSDLNAASGEVGLFQMDYNAQMSGTQQLSAGGSSDDGNSDHSRHVGWLESAAAAAGQESHQANDLTDTATSGMQQSQTAAEQEALGSDDASTAEAQEVTPKTRLLSSGSVVVKDGPDAPASDLDEILSGHDLNKQRTVAVDQGAGGPTVNVGDVSTLIPASPRGQQLPSSASLLKQDLAPVGEDSTSPFSSAPASQGCTWKIYLAVRFEKRHMMKGSVERGTKETSAPLFKSMAATAVQWIQDPSVRVGIQQVLPSKLPAHVGATRIKHRPTVSIGGGHHRRSLSNASIQGSKFGAVHSALHHTGSGVTGLNVAGLLGRLRGSLGGISWQGMSVGLVFVLVLCNMLLMWQMMQLQGQLLAAINKLADK